MNFARSLCMVLLLIGLPIGPTAANSPALRVGVLDDAPPLAFRDANGNLTGFSIKLAQALCAELNVRCEMIVTKLDYLVDDLAAGHFDLVAVGLLNTPERRQKIGFTKPVYRSVTLWFARAGIEPGQPGTRVAAFKGSAQESYARTRGWDTVGAQTDVQIIEQLTAGVAQAAIAPLMTTLSLQKDPRFLKLGLTPKVLQVPELDGLACYGINPRRVDLKVPLDEAIEKIKRNGVYDRINSQFLPFRVN